MSKQTSHDDPATGQLPAQKAMKQFSKTPAEREDVDAPVGPNSGPALTQRDDLAAPRPGDAGAGTSDNEGSSPYGDRSRKEKPQRES